MLSWAPVTWTNAWLGLKDPLLKCHSHMASKLVQFLVVRSWSYWEPSEPREQGRGNSIFYDLVWEFTCRHSAILCWSSWLTVTVCGKGLHQGMNTRRWESFGSILETGFYPWVRIWHVWQVTAVTRTCRQLKFALLEKPGCYMWYIPVMEYLAASKSSTRFIHFIQLETKTEWGL